VTPLPSLPAAAETPSAVEIAGRRRRTGAAIVPVSRCHTPEPLGLSPKPGCDAARRGSREGEALALVPERITDSTPPNVRGRRSALGVIYRPRCIPWCEQQKASTTGWDVATGAELWHEPFS
jgi:hypothetical protein